MSCTSKAHSMNIQIHHQQPTQMLWWLYQSGFSPAARFFWIISICFYQGFHSDTFTLVTRCSDQVNSISWVTWSINCPLIGHHWTPAHHFASIKDLALVLSFLSPWGLVGLGTSAQWVRAWQCRDERIRSEAGPVIVRPGAENLHESPLAPNMMDRWSHIDNLCSLVS